jgi:hypothetical protein
MEHSKYASEVVRWQEAFRLFRLSTSDYMRRFADLLQIHARAAQLVLDSLVISKECTFDKYLPEYKEIVSLVKDFYKDPKMQAVFDVDFGLIPTLHCVVKMCRDWVVYCSAAIGAEAGRKPAEFVDSCDWGMDYEAGGGDSAGGLYS